ncbi:hypothetical protein [Kribbella antibiotica]|nr:hypothetical protein [Kribbella antibiotica]
MTAASDPPREPGQPHEQLQVVTLGVLGDRSCSVARAERNNTCSP